jgi:hypothetical protein
MMDLLSPVRVPFDRLFLDPNNPRLGRDDKPGYADPPALFDERVQIQLEMRMRRTYKSIKELVTSILNMGWVPVDAMLAWEPPEAPGQFVVVEGNARTTALRMIRRDHARELARLAKISASGIIAPGLLKEQEDRVALYQRVADQTRELEILPVAAPSAADLARALPRLLGVRHISHAQQWKPHATNVYVFSLYRQLFEETYAGERFRLEDALIRQTAAAAGLNIFKVKRAVQAVVAFQRFRAVFEDRLPEGERFQDQDQNFFLYLFEPGYARDQLGLEENGLSMARDMEEVLFQWAFSKARGLEDGRENQNVLRSPDDIRTWNRIARYDDLHKTHFSRRLNVNRPEAARSVADMELDYNTHRTGRTPLETVLSLVEKLKGLEVEALVAHKEEIRPAIQRMLALGHDYLAMIDAIEGEDGGKRPKRRS